MDHAQSFLDQGKSFWFGVKKGTLSSYDSVGVIQKPSAVTSPSAPVIRTEPICSRTEALHAIQTIQHPNTVLLATTGKTGRELYDLNDKPNHFYQVGSMGCISALGLGLALHYQGKVIVIDGDGSALMRMGSWPTTGTYSPSNMLHILLDNHSKFSIHNM